jgi:hydrogenase maturation protease
MTDSSQYEDLRVAVVGVGNPIMGDDGIGQRVVDVLHEMDLPPDVEVTHAGTTAFLALEALSGADCGIVVDAISDGDSEPGTLHRYRLVDGSFEGQPPDVFMHDFSFSEAIRAGSDAYDLPPEVLVLGVEPAETTVGLDLTDPVAESLPDVVEAVLVTPQEAETAWIGGGDADRIEELTDTPPNTVIKG